MNNPLDNYIGIGKETAYGQAVAPSTFLEILESDGLQINEDIQFVETLVGGVLAKNKDAFKGKVEYSGGYEMPLFASQNGLLILSALGGVNSSLKANETDVYDHIFNEQAEKVSLTVEQKIGEIVKRFAGFIANGFKIEGKAGEMITFGVEGLAKTQADSGSSTPSYITEKSYNFSNVNYFKIGDLDYKANIEEFSIEYKNNIEPYYSLGSNELRAVYPKPSEITGSFTLFLDDQSKNIFNDYITNTSRKIEIEILGDNIGNASQNRFYIVINKAVFTSGGTKIGTDYNMVEVEFEGVYNKTEGKFLSVEMTNRVSNY